jgi:enoyl-CoA hydratase
LTDLRVERDGPVLWLTIDREERRNALSAAGLRGILDALNRLDPAVRAVIITGAGEQAFCSGADLGQVADSAVLEQHEAGNLLGEVLLAVRACAVPVIARVQGLCLAGGVGLALSCDVVLASARAEFGLPEVRLGLWPFIVSALLARHVSPKHAMDLMLTGERVDAAAACRMGLASRVFAAETYDADVTAYVATVAAAAPVAVRLGKASFAAAAEMPLAPALNAMHAQLTLLATTQDAAEGIAAFFEKRSPRWTGR